MARVNLDEGVVVREYLAGASTVALAKKYGVHNSAIHRIVTRRGVARTVAEAHQLRMSRLAKPGSVIGLAEDLGVEVADLVPLLIKHGFILEKRS